MTQSYRLLPALLILLTLATPAFTQPTSEVPSQPSQSLPEGLSEVGRQAVLKWKKDGDVTGVIDLLEKQREAGVATPVDMAVLGTAYMQVGRGRQALDIFRPLAEQEQADPAVFFNAGRAALSVGDVRTAEAYLERSVRQIPDSPAARELGLLRGNQGRLVDAYQLLRPWVTRNMEDLQARSAFILVALKLGRAVEIEPLFEALHRVIQELV